MEYQYKQCYLENRVSRGLPVSEFENPILVDAKYGIRKICGEQLKSVLFWNIDLENKVKLRNNDLTKLKLISVCIIILIKSNLYDHTKNYAFLNNKIIAF